jgi:hypothetical protein
LPPIAAFWAASSSFPAATSRSAAAGSACTAWLIAQAERLGFFSFLTSAASSACPSALSFFASSSRAGVNSSNGRA